MNIALPVKIAGVGRYLPERIVPSCEIDLRCGLPPGSIERHSGVRERRWADGETSTYMGAQAATEALANAGLKLSDIELIVNASGTPEQAIPDNAPLIQRHLGLGESGIPCLSIHATCLSFIAALDLSASLLAAGRYQRILIVSSDIGSVGINFAEPESAALIGDAAAAVVVVNTPTGEASRIQAIHLETYGEGAYLTTINGGGSRRSPNDPATRPEDNLFHMEGPQLLRLGRRRLGPFLERLRPGLSGSLGGIQWVIPHQPSHLGLRTLRHFGWPEARVIRTLDWLGNCIAASIPVTLYEAICQGCMQRGDEVLLLGTGAGFSMGGVILIY